MANFIGEESDNDTVKLSRESSLASPTESLKTITRAKQQGMHPDIYSEDQVELDREVDIQERIPSNVGNALKNYNSKSSHHINSTKEETGALQKISDMASHIWYNISGEKNVLEDKINGLQFKGRNSEEGLNEGDQNILNGMYELQQDEIAEFNLSEGESIPGQVGAVINDAFSAVTNNKNLIGASALTGATLGFYTPFIGTAAVGAVTGLGIGVTTAMAVDTYYKTANRTWGDIQRMKNDDGTPLNLPHSTAQNISMGVGIFSGMLEATTGHVLTSGATKLLGLSGKNITRAVIDNVPLKAKLDILGHTIKSSGISSIEEISADLVARAGEHVARSGDTSLAGMTDAIGRTTDDLLNDAEFRKQLGMTGLVGGIASGTISSATSAVTYKGIKSNIENQNLTVEETLKQQQQVLILEGSMNALQSQDNFISMARATMETDFKKLSPTEMTELRKEMFIEAGYTDKLWFSEADVQIIQGVNPELADKLRSLDVTEAAANKTGAAYGVKPHNFMDLVEEFPTVSEYARLHPEAPNPLESKEVLNRLQDNQDKKQAILSDLGVDGRISPEQIKQLETLNEESNAIITNSGEKAYLDAPDYQITDIPDAQLTAFNEAQVETRKAVAEQVTLEFNQREERIENRVVKANTKIEKQNQRVKLSKELDIVERFKPVNKTMSPLAINPDSLPEDLREAYLAEPTLKKRKAFNKDGVTLEESAALAGVENGEELLKILANTPTEKQLLLERRQKAKDLRKQVKETRGKSLEQRREKIFDDVAKLEKLEINHMKEKQWTGTKQGLKKIMLETAKPATLNNQARVIVKNTKVSDINSRQYNAGRKASQKKAANHILRNEVPQAIEAKEQSMLNSELTRESLKMEVKLTDARVWLKNKLMTNKTKKTLQRGGVLKKVDDVLSIFNLLPNKQQALKQESYFQYLTNLEEQGITVKVPESLADVRQRGTDLTSEQYMEVVDYLKNLLHQAKNKNKLITRINKITKLKEIRSQEAIVVEGVLDLQEHPNFSEKRVDKVLNKSSVPGMQYISDQLGLASSMTSNLKNVALELDQENLSGIHQQNIPQRMVESETNKRERTFANKEQIVKIAEDYGEAEFKTAFNEVITIPEFEGYPHLGNGDMIKADLWYLLAYMGDPQAREQMGNFKSKNGEVMDIETVTRVLDQHLKLKDAKLTQNMVNIFKESEQASMDLHERTTGVRPDMVKGVPIEFKGIVMEGGYVPNNYLRQSDQEKVNRFLDIMGDKKTSMFGEDPNDKSRLYATLRSAEQTEQGRLKSRVGSAKPLDTSFMNFISAYEEIAHDLAYREAGIDTLKLLRSEPYSNAIKKVVGEAKYNLMNNAIIETVGKSHNEDALNPFSKERNLVQQGFRQLEQGFAIKTLGFKWRSVAMQPLSLISAKLRMGKTGGRHMMKAFAQSMRALNNGTYSEFVAAATDFNADVKFNNDNVDDILNRSIFDVAPKTRKFKNKKSVLLRAGLDRIKEMSMAGLQQFDIHIKTLVSMASANQFLSGDVEGFPQSKLDTMTEEQKFKEAKKYVKQVADLALTTSAEIDKNALEKIESFRLFTRFYTDVRSQYLTATSQIRKAKLSTKRGIEAAKSGDPKTAAKHALETIGTVSTLMLAHTLNQLYTDTLYDQETPIDDLKEVKNFDDFKNFMGRTTEYIALAPANVTLGSIPLSRDVGFALGGFKKKKKASTIPGQVLSDVTNAIVGLADLLEGEDLGRTQTKAIASTVSYIVSGIPVNGPLEIMDAITDTDTYDKGSRFVRNEVQRLNKAIDKFIDTNKDNPEQQEMIEGLKEVQEEINQVDVKSNVPENTQKLLKLNKWDDVNPETGAAGIYQFTEERWDEIAEEDPSLGLTDEGRYSQDTEEQEKAMEHSLKQNAKNLATLRVVVNNQNLYGAHRFGLRDYAAIMFSNNNEKLTDIVEDLTLFTGFTTVKSVKDHVSKKIRN